MTTTTSASFPPFPNREEKLAGAQIVAGSKTPFAFAAWTPTVTTGRSGNTPIPFHPGLLDRLRTPITRFHE